MIRYALLFFGFLSLSIGLIGVVTPVLPTTPFVLLALWLFSKSNPAMVARIKQNKLWSRQVLDWETRGAISFPSKILASSLMGTSIAGLWLSHAPQLVKIAVTALIALILLFLWTRPS